MHEEDSGVEHFRRKMGDKHYHLRPTAFDDSQCELFARKKMDLGMRIPFIERDNEPQDQDISRR